MNCNNFPTQGSIISSKGLSEYLMKQYNLEDDTKTVLNSRSMNDTYYVTSGGRSYFLRVTQPNRTTKENLLLELRILNYLKENGINVIEVVKDREGNIINSINSYDGERFIILTKKIEGKNYFDNDCSVDQFYTIGKMISKIYSLLDSYPENIEREFNEQQLLIDPLDNLSKVDYLPKRDIDYLRSISPQLISRVEELLPRKLPEYGLIHGDFCPGHIIFNREDIPTIFDFEFIGNGWRAYDLSVYLTRSGIWGISQDSLDERVKRIDSFVEGFSKIRDLTKSELKALNIFVPFHRIWALGMFAKRIDINGLASFKHMFDFNIKLVKDWIDYYKIL